MTKRSWICAAALVLPAAAAWADAFTDALQWLAKYTACLGQYNMAQTGNYTRGDTRDYYKPSDIREYLAQQSSNRNAADVRMHIAGSAANSSSSA
jgi:hypothetical protein